MVTTIQVSEQLQKELAKRKLFDRESYEEVIWDLIEDTQELDAQTKAEVEKARTEIKKGKFVTHEQLKKELGL